MPDYLLRFRFAHIMEAVVGRVLAAVERRQDRPICLDDDPVAGGDGW